VAILERDSFASLGMTHGRLFVGQYTSLHSRIFNFCVLWWLLNFSTSKLLNCLPSPVSTFFKRALVIPAESWGLKVLNCDVLREKAFTGNRVGFSLSRH